MEETTNNSEGQKSFRIKPFRATSPEDLKGFPKDLQDFTEVSGSTLAMTSAQAEREEPSDVKKKFSTTGKIPFSPTTKGMTLFPKNGLFFMWNNSDFIPSAQLQAYVEKVRKNEELAFVILKTADGDTKFVSTLPVAEKQFAVALLAEFVEQSQPYLSETCNTNKAIAKENLKRKKARKEEKKKGRKEEETEESEETVAQNKLHGLAYQMSLNLFPVPYQEARIGQTEERVPKDIKEYMMQRYGVVLRDLWLDEGGKNVFEPCFTEGKFKQLLGFKRDGKGYYIQEKVPNVYETYICNSFKEDGETLDETIKIHKRRADKVIFLTRSEFCMKYFKANTKSYLYQNFHSIISKLGKKAIPVFSEKGKTNGDSSQFFNVYESFSSSDGKDYVMLKLVSPDVMEGIEVNNYVKFQENFENVLSQGEGVLLALWAYCMEVRARDYRKNSLKGVSKQELTLQELFECTATVSEIQEPHFPRYLQKLKQALAELQKEKIIIAWRVSGKGESDILKASRNDKIRIDIDLNFTKRKALSDSTK